MLRDFEGVVTLLNGYTTKFLIFFQKTVGTKILYQTSWQKASCKAALHHYDNLTALFFLFHFLLEGQNKVAGVFISLRNSSFERKSDNIDFDGDLDRQTNTENVRRK